MGKNNKYQYFKILKYKDKTTKDGADIINNNLTYTEGLKLFKKIRIEFESTSEDNVYIMFVGVNNEGTESIIKEKEILAVSSNRDNIIVIEPIAQKESMQNTESKESVGTVQEIETVDNIEDTGSIENMSVIEDMVNKNIQDEDDFDYSNCEDEDDNSEESEASTQRDEEPTLKEEETSNEEINKKDTIEFNEYIDNLNNSIKEIENDSLATSLSSVNLKEYYKHISEINSKDIIRILVDAFNILEERHNYNNDMVDLLTKKRDCYCHDFENLDKMSFKSIEEQNKFVLELGANMHNTGTERRKFKNEYSMTEQVFKNLPKIRPAYYTPLTDIEKSIPKFDIKKATNIKTYVYNYNTQNEREILLDKLNKAFDKIVDVKWGQFECYNKVGSANSKKMLKDIDFEVIDKIDVIDEASAKSYESIINQTVIWGNTFLKTKGSSVKITKVNKKAVQQFTKSIYHKYSKCAYETKSQTLYLIQRL